MLGDDSFRQLLGRVDVWMVSPEAVDADVIDSRMSWLATKERGWYQQLRSAALRREYLLTRVLCRSALSRYVDVRPQDWQFARTATGKPQVVAPAELASLRFSLTHTEGLIACAVTRAGEVGVDAERVSESMNLDRISFHFFTESDRNELAQLDGKARTLRFFELWVAKEACVKGSGLGVSEFENGFAIPPEWQVTLHRPTPSHVAATAVKPRQPEGAVPVEWRFADWL